MIKDTCQRVIYYFVKKEEMFYELTTQSLNKRRHADEKLCVKIISPKANLVYIIMNRIMGKIF